MPSAHREPNQARLLTGEDQISWTPDTPVPSGIAVENMRRRGIDQLQITIPHSETRVHAILGLGKKTPRTATITFAEDLMQLIIPARRGTQSVETVVERKDIGAVRIHNEGLVLGSSLQISVGDETFNLGTGLPAASLAWLRERVLLETAGLVSKPLFNVGRRLTRKTSNPDDDFYKSWPSGPNRLLSLFLQETPEQVRLLEDSIQNSDWEAAAKQCHWLKSSSAAVGAAQLSELCQRMEINIVTRDYSQIESLHVHLGQELQRVSDTLRGIVNGEPEAQPADASQDAHTKNQNHASELQGVKILLVEDSLVNQEVACCSLDDAGCNTTVASNGEAAIELFDKETFDLILMDCQMPGIDGFEATRTLRNIESLKLLSRTPIIALTANALKDDHKTCLAAGMNDYLSKPYQEHELLEMIIKWLPEAEAAVEQESVAVAG
ncbi:MAG: response regulator, partial [Hyphomicrobiaceae bacterium]